MLKKAHLLPSGKVILLDLDLRVSVIPAGSTKKDLRFPLKNWSSCLDRNHQDKFHSLIKNQLALKILRDSVWMCSPPRTINLR